MCYKTVRRCDNGKFRWSNSGVHLVMAVLRICVWDGRLRVRDDGDENFIRELKVRPLYVVLVDDRNVGADSFDFGVDPALANT